MKRLALTFVVLLLVLVTAGLMLLPYFLKQYIEKNDLALIGREVTIGDIDFNPFSGYFSLEEGTVYETDGTTPFLNFDLFEVNMRIWSVLSGIYEVEYARLIHPTVRMIQTGTSYNYDDFKDHWAREDAPADTAAAAGPVKYVIRDIQLMDGEFIYTDNNLESTIDVTGIHINVPSLSHDVPAIDVFLDGIQKEGGTLHIVMNVNWENHTYDVSGGFDNWQLRPYKNYLDDYLAIRDFAGLFTIDARVHGEYADSARVSFRFDSAVEDLLLVDHRSDSLLRWRALRFTMDSVNSGQHIYDVGDLLLQEPRVLVKYFEEGDNFSSLYVDTATTATLDTVQVASGNRVVFQNPFQYITETLFALVDEEALTTYGADTMAITNANLLFQDFSHLEEARLALSNAIIAIDRIEPSDTTVHLLVSSDVNSNARLDGDLLLYRNGSENVAMNLSLTEFQIADIDLYSRFYTAHPLWQGNMRLSSKTRIIDKQLNSENHLFITRPDVGKKIQMEAEYKVPLRFAISLLKDVDGNVDLELPIEGDLSDPKYRIGKIIMDVIVNLFIKAAASPYKLLANAFNASEEDLKAIQFLNDQDSLGRAQIKSMDLTARILNQKEDLAVTLTYVMNEEQEREFIAINRAKRQFLATAPDSISDIAQVGDRDSLFVMFLDDQVGGLGSRTVAEMCADLVGAEQLDARVNELQQIHQDLVSAYMFTEKGLPPDRLRLVQSEGDSLARTHSRPVFLIDYSVADVPGATPGDSLQASPPDSTLVSKVRD